MNKKTLIWIIILIVAVVIFVMTRPSAPTQTEPTGTPISASYSCSAGKTVAAAYYQGQAQAASTAGGPGAPGGSVVLTLSDGRTLTLPQTISADGARYSSADGSVVFWNVGNTAELTESDQETYASCVEVMSDPGGLPQAYASTTAGFSLRYPTGFTVDESYTYQELGPGKDISGVKFTIPKSEAAGTNLGSDSYLSVEKISGAQDCTADMFLQQQGPFGLSPQMLADSGTTYSVASTTGAGAGNRYFETVYAISGSNPCLAIRYFIHYGVIDNYPAGTVTQFDQAALLSQFDSIRRTLTIAQ